MKHVTLLKIGSGYVAEYFQSSNIAFPQVKNNIIVCVDADSNIQLYLIVLSWIQLLTSGEIRRNPPMFEFCIDWL